MKKVIETVTGAKASIGNASIDGTQQRGESKTEEALCGLELFFGERSIFKGPRSGNLQTIGITVFPTVTVYPVVGGILVQFTLAPARSIHVRPIPVLTLALFGDTLAQIGLIHRSVFFFFFEVFM